MVIMRRPYLNYGVDNELVFNEIDANDDEGEGITSRADTLVGDAAVKNFSIE